MSKPIGWGKGIAFVYVFFAVAILSMVIYASFQRVDLVARDYYDREIRYQQQIDRMARRDSLLAHVIIEHDLPQQMVRLRFPDVFLSKRIQGSIHLFRPSDGRLDRRFPIALDENGLQSIDVGKFSRGNWKLLLDWRADSLDFYQEQLLYLE